MCHDIQFSCHVTQTSLVVRCKVGKILMNLLENNPCTTYGKFPTSKKEIIGQKRLYLRSGSSRDDFYNEEMWGHKIARDILQ